MLLHCRMMQINSFRSTCKKMYIIIMNDSNQHTRIQLRHHIVTEEEGMINGMASCLNVFVLHFEFE